MNPFLIDEDCPLLLETLLHNKGLDAVHVRTAGLCGTKDPALFQWAQKEQRIIVSRDMGWANILRYPPGAHAGIIVLRLSYNAVAIEIGEAFVRFLSAIDLETVPGALVIVEKDRFRLRVDVL